MMPLFLSLFLGSVLVSTGSPADASGSETPASQTQSEASVNSAIGTVAQIKGDVMAVPSAGNVRELAEGDPVYADETITTASGASIQIELADESLFTVSENTSISVKDFDYDENAADGTLVASVTKGIFRFISGKIAKAKPEKVNIEIPSGMIGIRGTIVVGEIKGERCLVSLEAEEGDKVQHRIVVSSKTGDKIQEVEITKPGFGTVIEKQGLAPQPVFQVPQEQLNRFQQHLAKPQYLPRGEDGRPKQNPSVMNPRERRPEGSLKQGDDQNKKGDGPNPPDQGQGPKSRGDGQGPDGPESFGKDRQTEPDQEHGEKLFRMDSPESRAAQGESGADFNDPGNVPSDGWQPGKEMPEFGRMQAGNEFGDNRPQFPGSNMQDMGQNPGSDFRQNGNPQGFSPQPFGFQPPQSGSQGPGNFQAGGFNQPGKSGQNFGPFQAPKGGFNGPGHFQTPQNPGGYGRPYQQGPNGMNRPDQGNFQSRQPFGRPGGGNPPGGGGPPQANKPGGGAQGPREGGPGGPKH